MKKKKIYKLGEWIERVTPKKLAKILEVEVSGVRHWRRGIGLPKTKQMLAIKKLSKGVLTCDVMIEEYHSLPRSK